MNQDQQLREALQVLADFSEHDGDEFCSQPTDERILKAAKFARSFLTATQQAAPSRGEVDRAYGYAKRLAESIWERHYKDVSPNWEAMDTLIGILTQIDNMAAGLLEASAQREQPAASKPESQAQAGEPEVVAWLQPAIVDSFKVPGSYETCRPSDYGAFAVITLQYHREAMAKANSLMEMSLATIESLREANAKKAAALKARVEEAAKAIYSQWKDRVGYVPWVDGGNSIMQDDARAIARAAITQGQEALK